MKRVLRGATWSLSGTVLTQVVALCTSIALARVLGSHEFGEVAVIRNTATMLASLISAGLAIAATKHVAELQSDRPELVGSVLTVIFAAATLGSAIGVLVLQGLSSLVSQSLLKAPHLRMALDLSAVLLVSQAVGGVQNGVLIGLSAFRAFAILVVIEATLLFSFGVLGAAADGRNGAILGLGLGATFGVLARQAYLTRLMRSKSIPISFQHFARAVRLLSVVALPSTLVGTYVQFSEWVARVLLARGTDGFNQVAIFTAAHSLATVTQIIPGQVSNATMPALSQTFSSGSRHTFFATVARTAWIAILSGLAVAGALALSSPYLLGLYGHSFSTNSSVLVVLALTYAVSVVTMVFSAAMIAANRTWLQLGHKVLWGAVMICSALPLLVHGALGLAFAYALGNAVFTVVQYMAIRHLAKQA